MLHIRKAQAMGRVLEVENGHNPPASREAQQHDQRKNDQGRNTNLTRLPSIVTHVADSVRVAVRLVRVGIERAVVQRVDDPSVDEGE